jgi:hypothetical protein
MGHATSKRELQAYVTNLGAIIATLRNVLARINQYPYVDNLKPDPFDPPDPPPDEFVRRELIAEYCYEILKDLCKKKNRDSTPGQTDPGAFQASNGYDDQMHLLTEYCRRLRDELNRKLSKRAMLAVRKSKGHRIAAELQYNGVILLYIHQINDSAFQLPTDDTGQVAPKQPTDTGHQDTVDIESAMESLLGTLLNSTTSA